MAEERIIDDDEDRNKKYRFKMNEDGEEELEVNEEQQAPAPELEAVYDVEEPLDEPEEEQGLTPEEEAAIREREQKRERERKEKIESLLAAAKKDISVYHYATALEYLQKVEELDETNPLLHEYKLVAYTRNFTDYSQIEDAAKVADGVKQYVSAEKKAEMLELGGEKLEAQIAAYRTTVTKLNEENEQQKGERRVKFAKDRNIALIIFAVTVALLGTFIGLTAHYAGIIYTVGDGSYLRLTIVFAALAFVSLIALAFAARRLSITVRRLNLNKKNTTTRLGRELLSEQEKLRSFIAVYSVLKGE